MATNLKKLNEDLRRRKAKVEKVRPNIDSLIAQLASAIEKNQQPIITIEAKKPVSYKATFTRNSRGDLISAVINPIE